MNRLGHRLGIACAAILSALTLARSSGAEPLVAPPANGLVKVPAFKNAGPVEPPEKLALQGISMLGNEPIALLGLKTHWVYLSYWQVAGDSFFGYTLAAIAKDHAILARRDTGAKIRVPLAAAPPTASNVKPYSRAWINSRANPMLLQAQEMPGRIFIGEWEGELPASKKAQILKFYRKHGWQLIPSKPDPQAREFKWLNLYEAERAAAIEANRENFERTLTPEQLGLWQQVRGLQIAFPAVVEFAMEPRELIAARQRMIDEITRSLTPGPKAGHEPEKFKRFLTAEQVGRWQQVRGFQDINPGADGFTKEQLELMAARQRIIDEFKKSLTPEQKAAHESIHDFTKASWK